MIHGLTDRNAAFPEIGQIRKGAPKTDPKKPGPDLDYFRFVSADPALKGAFAEAFGEQPQEIRFISPFNTVSEVFEAWREAYTASSLQHRCDGRMTVRTLTPNGYSDKPEPCPGGCKQVGRLKIIVPLLKRLGFVTVHTTSIWDILTIYQNLTALEMLRGSLRGIPLILRRVKRAISTPNGNGQRARREKWLLTIEAAPDWVALELDAIQRQALPSASEPLMLTEGAPVRPDPDEENDEFELMCDAETQRAIETLWQTAGYPRKGETYPQPLAEFLKKNKGVDSLENLTAESGSKLLELLQKRALEIQHPEPPKAEPGRFVDWPCGPELAQEIEDLTYDLKGMGVKWTAIDSELCLIMKLDESEKPNPAELTIEQAKEWVNFLKDWVRSRS